MNATYSESDGGPGMNQALQRLGRACRRRGSGELLRALLATLLLGLVAGLWTTPAWAVAYASHDMRQLLIPASKPGGGGTLNLAFLDRVLADLALHAADYPPQFDSPEDMQRARKDARTLIGMFHQAFGAAPPQGLLLRMAMLGTYGHNLDVPEAAAFAQNHFQKLLATDAGHATGNYQYGAFLAATGRPRESLPYLNKARDQGVTPALYSIGMAQLSLGDQKSALVSLDEYLKRNPTDQRVRMLADAIRSGKVKIQTKQGG